MVEDVLAKKIEELEAEIRRLQQERDSALTTAKLSEQGFQSSIQKRGETLMYYLAKFIKLYNQVDGRMIPIGIVDPEDNVRSGNQALFELLQKNENEIVDSVYWEHLECSDEELTEIKRKLIGKAETTMQIKIKRGKSNEYPPLNVTLYKVAIMERIFRQDAHYCTLFFLIPPNPYQDAKEKTLRDFGGIIKRVQSLLKDSNP